MEKFIDWHFQNEDILRTWPVENLPPQYIKKWYPEHLKQSEEELGVEDIANEIIEGDPDDNPQVIENPWNASSNVFEETEKRKRKLFARQEIRSQSNNNNNHNHNNSDNNSNDDIKSAPVTIVNNKDIPENLSAYQIAKSAMKYWKTVIRFKKNWTVEDSKIVDQHPLAVFYYMKPLPLLWYLSQIACSYFVIPGSNVIAERVIALSKKDISPQRNKLQLKTIEDMITLQESIIAQREANELQKQYSKLLPKIMDILINKTNIGEQQIIIDNTAEWLSEQRRLRNYSSMFHTNTISIMIHFDTCTTN